MSAEQQELIESALRLAVALANMYAAWSTARATRWAAEAFRPHLWFVSFWSVVSGACMGVLALGPPLSYTIEILNLSALFMIGGWATLVARLTKHVQPTVAHRRQDK